MSSKFKIKTNNKGEFYFELYASNGQKIARSATEYTTKAACENGVIAVKVHSFDAIVEEE